MGPFSQVMHDDQRHEGQKRHLLRPFQSKELLKAVYYTTVVHNFNLQEKTTSTVEVTTNFVKKFQAHFEKKLLH